MSERTRYYYAEFYPILVVIRTVNTADPKSEPHYELVVQNILVKNDLDIFNEVERGFLAILQDVTREDMDGAVFRIRKCSRAELTIYHDSGEQDFTWSVRNITEEEFPEDEVVYPPQECCDGEYTCPIGTIPDCMSQQPGQPAICERVFKGK